MLLGVLASVILGFILSFFGFDDWYLVHICPEFIRSFGIVFYYVSWASIGAIVGYFGK